MDWNGPLMRSIIVLLLTITALLIYKPTIMFEEDGKIIPFGISWPALNEARSEILELERRMRSVEQELRALARQLPMVSKLCSIPGIGLITSTALFAFVGDVGRFPSARHFASYLGLTPREHSSGLRRRLGGISKRGDGYLRMLLTHGARAVLWRAKARKEPDRLRAWVLDLEQRRGHNKAAIGLANKLARIVWAVWRRDVEFVEQMPTAA